MKGIVITTDCAVSVQDFGQPLYQTTGSVVDGWIEIVHPKRLPAPLVMIVNEDGLAKELPVNLVGTALYAYAPIVGNIVIMQDGYNADGEPDIVGIPDEDIDHYLPQFEELCERCKNILTEETEK